jgi:hypothetical protein
VAVAEIPKSTVEMRDFPGMATRVDPDDYQEGMSQVQINLDSNLQGELRTRSGYREVTFEE